MGTELRMSLSPGRWLRDKQDVRKLTSIPGIGVSFARDFALIGIHSVDQLVDADAQKLFDQLCEIKDQPGNVTSRSYLYLLRMAIYYANGGRDRSLLKWSAWSDREVAGRNRDTPKPKAAKKA